MQLGDVAILRRFHQSAHVVSHMFGQKGAHVVGERVFRLGEVRVDPRIARLRQCRRLPSPQSFARRRQPRLRITCGQCRPFYRQEIEVNVIFDRQAVTAEHAQRAAHSCPGGGGAPPIGHRDQRGCLCLPLGDAAYRAPDQQARAFHVGDRIGQWKGDALKRADGLIELPPFGGIGRRHFHRARPCAHQPRGAQQRQFSQRRLKQRGHPVAPADQMPIPRRCNRMQRALFQHQPGAARLGIEADRRNGRRFQQGQRRVAIHIAQQVAGGDPVGDRQGRDAPPCRLADQRRFHQPHAQPALVLRRAHGDEPHFRRFPPQGGIGLSICRAGRRDHIVPLEKATRGVPHHGLLLGQVQVHRISTLFATISMAILHPALSIFVRGASDHAERRG